MNAATKLICKAMRDDLGFAITSQFRAYAEGQSFAEQNPNAMRKALEWLVEHDRMLEQALGGEGYEALNDLAAEIEQALEEARR